MEQNIEIGIVSIKYNQDGHVLKALFEPNIKIQAEWNLIHQLRQTKGDNIEDIKFNSDLIFANWFTAWNRIELYDPLEYRIEGEVVLCEKHSNGVVKECKMKYSLKKITNASN